MASGCQQADWLLTPSTIVVNGTPRLRPDGRPEVRACYLPAAECEILDTWWTTGLRGTGSHDVRVSGAFVPEERSFPLLFAGRAEPGSLFVSRFSVRARPNIAAVALGIARDAIDSFTELARAKTPTLATATLATQHTIHERVGRAEALVRAGRACVHETLRALPTAADWSVDLDDELAAQVRLASAHAAHSAAEAVDLLFTAGGTTSIYTHSRLERCFRDVHTVTQHVGVAASNIETVGRYLLGLGLDVQR
jgi:alkylation response protein AidB-like acyl-CoA dehydrogenase